MNTSKKSFAGRLVLALLFSSAVSLSAQKEEADHGAGSSWWGGGGWASMVVHSGRGTVVNALVAEHRTIVADTGELPAAGGVRNAHALDVNIPGVLTANVAHAATIGHGNRTRSEASLTAMNLTLAGQSITADLVVARARSMCDRDNSASQGMTDIVNLAINGQPVTVSGEPNQIIEVPGLGTITINEQTTTDGANASDITVNALHVRFGGEGSTAAVDVVIGHARSDVSCGAAGCSGSDFMSGYGWVATGANSRGRFGFVAGTRGTMLFGHLGFMDHAAQLRVRGMNVTSYTNTGDGSRRIEGRADINGQLGTYTLNVTDNGLPGTNDTFSLQLSNGYSATGNLVRGNIQLHEPCGK